MRGVGAKIANRNFPFSLKEKNYYVKDAVHISSNVSFVFMLKLLFLFLLSQTYQDYELSSHDFSYFTPFKEKQNQKREQNKTKQYTDHNVIFGKIYLMRRISLFIFILCKMWKESKKIG